LDARTDSLDARSALVLRQEMNGISEAPGKVWFWELAAAVIDAERCVQCGACVAACPTDSIGIGASDLPELVKMCTGCSLCWDFCPRGGLRYESTWLREGSGQENDWRITGVDPAPGLGVTLERLSARARPGGEWHTAGAQDGGVVSAVLSACLAAGEIDGAIVACEDPANPWKGIPVLATSPEEIRKAAGSFYNQTSALASLDLAGAGLRPGAKVAVVGTPCEIQGIRALQARPWRRGRSNVDAVVLTIALLCTKSFDYRKLLLKELRDDRGIELERVSKIDVVHGRLEVEDQSGATILDEPIKDFHGAALKGCDECADFLGRGADISVGSVGSDEGYSSVLIRTDAGHRAFRLATGELEIGELPRPEELERLDRLDKRAARGALQRELDPDGPLFIDFTEHVTFYGGTDRAPVWR
jgi:coenzyme F420 hydrogenase subunit beta